jgi:hypothetical protein
MFTIVLQVAAPPGAEMAIKETLGMYMEKFGDTRVISITEDVPEQMGMGAQFQQQSPMQGNNRYPIRKK